MDSGGKYETQTLENQIYREYLSRMRKQYAVGVKPMRLPYEEFQQPPGTTTSSFGRSSARRSRPMGDAPLSASRREASAPLLPRPASAMDSRPPIRTMNQETEEESVQVIDATNDYGVGKTMVIDLREDRYRLTPTTGPSINSDRPPQNGAPFSSADQPRRTHPRPLSAPKAITRVPRPSSYTGIRRKKKAPLYLRQPDTLLVTAIANGNRDNFSRVAAPNLVLLLQKCTHLLSLPSAARRIFLADGTEIKSEHQVPREAEIYVSMGEAFRDPRKQKIEEELLRENASWSMSGLVLPPDRKRKCTKPKISKRFCDLNERKRSRVLVFKNGFGVHGYEVVSDMKDVDAFLLACTAKFDMGAPARKLLTWDGTEIENLYELPEVDPILLRRSQGVTVHGPVWVTKGEGYSPSGVEQYLNDVIKYLSNKLASAKNYVGQLEAAKEGRRDDVRLMSVLSLSPTELDEALDHANTDAEMYKEYLKKYRQMHRDIETEASKERAEGSNYSMKHIAPLENRPNGTRFVGPNGLKLEAYENGEHITSANKCDVYFNIREASRGIKDRKLLMQRFLDHLSVNLHLVSKNNQSRGILVRRVFDSNGEEITDVAKLQMNSSIWVSHGEPWINPNIYCLDIDLTKVVMEKHDNGSHIIRENLPDTMDKLGDPDLWEAVRGVPEKIEVRRAQDEDLISTEGKNNSDEQSFPPDAIDENSTFLECKKKKSRHLALYPEVCLSIKLRGEAREKGSWPNGSRVQTWMINKRGQIYLKAFPQLALTLSGYRLEDCCLPEDGTRELDGYLVEMAPRSDGDALQKWQFATDGFLHNQDNYDFLLTDLSTISAARNSPDAVLPLESDKLPRGRRCFLAGCSRLGGSAERRQRWGVKQERFDILGQWKFSDVTNPAWNKMALSWPLKRDGDLNDKFEWPLEGYLISNAPTLEPPERDSKQFTLNPVRLMVLRNGERKLENAVAITGPDLSNLVKTSRSAGGKKKRKRQQQPRDKSPAASHDGAVDETEPTTVSTKEDGGSVTDGMQDDKLHCTDVTLLELEFVQFLERCTGILGLASAARRLFDARGIEHHNLRDLQRDELVFVSTGELWADPRLSEEELKIRALLCKLGDDLERIRHFVEIRHSTDLVVSAVGGLQPGARLVVATVTRHRGRRRGRGQSPTASGKEESVVSGSSPASDTSDEEGDGARHDDNTGTPEDDHRTAHERACEKAQSNKKHRYQWMVDPASENVTFQNVDMSEGEQEGKHSHRQSSSSPRHNPRNLQRFQFDNGFICCRADPDLVLAVQSGEGRVLDILLQKRALEAVNQRWILKNNGFIESKYRPRQVLTVLLPKLSPTAPQSTQLSYNNCPLTLQAIKATQFGRAHQQFTFTGKTGRIRAFASNLLDQEITAANTTNICTASVTSEAIDQSGYLTYLPTKESKARGVYICVACARALRGRYKLQKVQPGSVDFVCCFGKAEQLGLLDSGSFRCLNGKVDLSVHEATASLTRWEGEARQLREAVSVRQVANRLTSAAQSSPPIRLLAYRNGEARLTRPEVIVGSSWQGLMDQCRSRLDLPWAVRNLYVEDGTAIVDLADLTNWVDDHRTLVRQRSAQLEAGDNGLSPEVAAIREQVLEEIDINDSSPAPSPSSEADRGKSKKNVQFKKEEEGEPEDEQESSLPDVVMSPDGDYFMVGSPDGPGSMGVYEIAIEIMDLINIDQLLPPDADPAHVRYYTLSYSIFSHTVATDIFTRLEAFENERTEIRIRARFPALKLFFTKVSPQLELLLKASPTKTSPDPGPLVARATISLEYLVAEKLQTSQTKSTRDIYPFYPAVSGGDEGQAVSGVVAEVGLTCMEILSAPDVRTGDEDGIAADEAIAAPQEENNEDLDDKALPVEVWASMGEAFVPLANVYAEFRKMLTERAKSGELTLNLDTERHILRHMVARRLQECSPGQYTSTMDAENPVLIEGNWQTPGPGEREQIAKIQKLEAQLNEVKRQKPAEAPKLSGELYRQPVLRRVLVFVNGESPKKAVTVWGDSVYQLMENAALRLGLHKAPKFLYNLDDGQPVRSIEQLERDQPLAVSTGEEFLPPLAVQQVVEIRANWGRARRQFGPKATEFNVLARPNPIIGIDPFGPPGMVRRQELPSFDKKLITVYQNGRNPESGVRITGTSIEDLLERATKRLNMTKQGVCFFTREGMKINEFEEILRNDTLAISTTGKFIKIS